MKHPVVKNVLASMKGFDLGAVVREAAKPNSTPSIALKSGQSVPMPDGSYFTVISTNQCVAPDTWDRPETIRESVESIKPKLKTHADKMGTSYGNIEALVVQGVPGKFEVLSGKSRWLASKELGLTVLVKVLPTVLVGVERLMFEVMMNRARTDLSGAETIKAAVTLEAAGAKKEEIAHALNRKVRAVYGYLQVAKNPALMKRISSGELTLADAKDSLALRSFTTLDADGNVPGTKTPSSKGTSTKDRAPGQAALTFIQYDEKRGIAAVRLNFKTATKQEKAKYLKLLKEMMDHINKELNPLDPRKKDRRGKDAVTPARRRKVDKD